jgi:hypothetical protein
MNVKREIAFDSQRCYYRNNQTLAFTREGTK